MGWRDAALAVAAASVAVGTASASAHSQDDGPGDGHPACVKAYDLLQAASDALITVWDPQLVDPNGESAMIRFGPLIEALGRAAPDATIMMFSWVDQSATAEDLFDARVGEDATEINGHRLAVAIDQALAQDWAGELQIIGHSFGANVATIAALSVDQRPRQLTLFDSPDDGLTRLGGAANDLRYKLPRLRPRTGDGPDVRRQLLLRGRYQVRRLRGARLNRRRATAATGRARCRPGPPAPDRVVDRRLGGRAADGAGWPVVVSAAGRRSGDGRVVLRGRERRRPARADRAQRSAVRGGRRRCADARRAALPSGTEVTVGGTSPVVEAGFETTEDSLLLEFAVEFDEAASGGTLTLGVDGRERYTAVGPSDGDGAPGAFVLLWDVEPGDHTLTIALTGATEGAATLSALRIVQVNDIVRNETAEQTDALTVMAIVFVVVLVIGLLVGAVLIARALLRRRRRR